MQHDMKKFILLFALAFALAASGCVKPAAKIGCCAKANITEGCMLLNMTTSELNDYTGATNGPCDSNDTAYNTTGYCNVTIGDTDYLVPICTDAELNDCLNPNCTAMVCGDFMFQPKVAPGVIATEDGEAEVEAPPQSEQEDEMLG
ncbi:hypothetical protein H0O02_04430, partial [Candidatus Micrarchaeota archaeon]|nr:hypothetical protein [Candidatus Micrarchaeota archaeon]